MTAPETGSEKLENEAGLALDAIDFSKQTPVFLQIFKTRAGGDRDGYLAAWGRDQTGRYRLVKRWPICAWSGAHGPKFREGDRQSPEGFYRAPERALNPNSAYHLSFNLGFPNQFDRYHGRTGSFLMVHGACVSIGCYAMGDAAIEEIYRLLETAFRSGQKTVPVETYPFEMNAQNLSRFAGHEAFAFWQMLKPAYDHFKTHGVPARIVVENGRYTITENAPL